MSNVEEFRDMALNPAKGELGGPAGLDFDPARYRADLDGFDMDEAQKEALLDILWSIMCSFVELGFHADVSNALLADIGLIPTKDELG